MGSFQVCYALGILFKLEKPLVEHLEGFIFLLKKGGRLQKNFRTFDWKFQLKNSKKFPH
jgi:hypothetical protein